MKSTTRIFAAVLLAFPLSAMVGQAIAVEAGHDHAEAAQQTMQLNNGQKWETDAPLRQGMGTLYEIVTGGLSSAHANQATPGDYRQMSEKVVGQIGYIVQNCKLPPEADAQLHILLGNIAQGAEALEGKVAGEQPEAGLVKIAQALNNYGTHFDHPDWKAIDVAH